MKMNQLLSEQIEKKTMELLPKSTSLIYIDYNDNLDSHHDLMEECVKENSMYPLDQEVFDWYIDAENDSMEDIISELKDDLSGTFDEDDIKEYFKDNDEKIKEEIRNRCDDNPVQDLIRNTGRIIMFYDTGKEYSDLYASGTKDEIQKRKKDIKRFLKIKDNTYDREIHNMVAQAGYGGYLVVYVYTYITDFITEEEPLGITFSDPVIAIIDTANGSGDHCELGGHSFTLPFDRSNLYVERNIKYNYSFAVCGMTEDWCKDTKWELTYTKPKRRLNKSTLDDNIKIDRQFAEVYKQGKCSYGDMDIKRHRDVYYRNNYPCGHKCPHCGTFWID